MLPHLLALVPPALMALAAPPSHASRTAHAPDTVDVAVGSPLVDFSKHAPGVTRAHQSMTMGEQHQSMPPFLWTFTFSDTGGRPLLLVQGAPEQPAPGRPAPPRFVFDRRTLALLGTRDAATNAPGIVVEGTHVGGHAMGPNGPMPLDATLERPGFFAPLADLLVESLPRKLGTVYRVPLWGPPAMKLEAHLYQAVRREDITVLGRTYPKAWVVEDRTADGTLRGTLWLVDQAPHLVRWVINQPNGATVTLDQEAASPHP